MSIIVSELKTKNYKYFLDENNFKDGRIRMTSKKKTSYGYIVKLFTNYVSIYTKKIYVYPDGKAKCVTIVDQNYHPKYQHTTYFTKEGNEIISDTNSTREELNYWKQL